MPTQQYNQDEMWKIYETLPEELKQAVFSAENADHIFSICERYDIQECSKLASLVGLVLMGVLLPRDFAGALVQELGLQPDIAQRASQEVNRFVFYPVKTHIEQLHRKVGEEAQKPEVGIPTPRHGERIEEYTVEPEQSEKSQEPKEVFTEEQRQPRKDIYRESIE